MTRIIGVPMGLACLLLSGASAFARAGGVIRAGPVVPQGRPIVEPQSRPEENDPNATSCKIDWVLGRSEKRVGQSLEQTGKEIERLRKELVELIDLRSDMALALVELKAEDGMPIGAGFLFTRSGHLQQAGARNSQPPAPGVATPAETRAVSENLPPREVPGEASPPINTKESRRKESRREDRDRALRRIRGFLQTELDSVRGRIDPLASELRTLRGQEQSVVLETLPAGVQPEMSLPTFDPAQTAPAPNQPRTQPPSPWPPR